MQIFVKQRATETGDITFDTPAIDVSGQSLLITELIVYSIAGTSPQFLAQLESSNDLLTWSNVTGVQLDLTAAGSDVEPAKASDRPYGRYVRFRVAITGTLTSVEYSLVLNTHASS